MRKLGLHNLRRKQKPSQRQCNHKGSLNPSMKNGFGRIGLFLILSWKKRIWMRSIQWVQAPPRERRQGHINLTKSVRELSFDSSLFATVQSQVKFHKTSVKCVHFLSWQLFKAYLRFKKLYCEEAYHCIETDVIGAY